MVCGADQVASGLQRDRQLAGSRGVFLRHKSRGKNSNEHWRVAENRAMPGARAVQRLVLYLGEIDASQQAAWCRSITAMDENDLDTGRGCRNLARVGWPVSHASNRG
jgi:hypothetical protein